MPGQSGPWHTVPTANRAHGEEDRTARLWDATGKPIGEPIKHEERSLAVAYGPDGATVLTAARQVGTALGSRTGKLMG